MPRMKVSLATLLLLPLSGQAQTLAEFIDSSNQKNVDTRLGVVATVRAQREADQAWGSLLPSLSATGGWTHNQYPAIVTLPTGATTSQTITIVPQDQLDATLKAEVPVIDPSRWFRAAAALSSAKAAEARQHATLDEVHRQVIGAFYLLAGAHSVHASAVRSLAVAEAQLQQQQARSAAGTATELEVVRANAEVERNRQLMADTQAQVANATRSLRTLTGLEPVDVPAIVDDDLHAERPLSELEARFEELPRVRAADEESNASQRSSQSAAATLAPTVNAQFSQRFTNATGFQGQSTLWNAGLTFNWRLDVAGVQALRASATQEQTAALNAERARLQAQDQIQTDWQRVNSARTKVAASKAQVGSALRAATLARERNAAGMATQLDIIQSDRDVFLAEVNDIQARFELASARAALRLSAGLPWESPR